MPPFIPQKRCLSTPPSDISTPKSPKKPTLFDTADRSDASTTLRDNKAFFDRLNDSESESSLSDVSSNAFENSLQQSSPKKRKVKHDEEDDDEIDWEDAIEPGTASSIAAAAPGPSGDLELTLDKNARFGSWTNPHDQKKGPSKIERQIRVSTHCMHVQFLLFHNLIRNGWSCDREAQSNVVSQLPPTFRKEIERWKTNSGIVPDIDCGNPKIPPINGRKAKKTGQNKRNQRDWGKPAGRLEKGVPNMSSGDPIIRLLKLLATYWKRRFTITAPGLRKQGYKSLSCLEEELASFKNENHDPGEYGEHVDGIEGFRKLAKTCKGSRDIGAQLFTTLLRGLGLEARLVASLQPVGFGWSRNEEASAKKKKTTKDPQAGFDNDYSESNEASNVKLCSSKTTASAKQKSEGSKKAAQTEYRSKGAKDAPIDILESSKDLSVKDADEDEDDESVVDVTPPTPRKRPNMNYDRDMPWPTYWTEVISPITNEVYPVDALILTHAVATSPEHLAQFEPRGVKADKAKQVFAYVVAYSKDGTAKDVTTRYLKRHMWPGRTKGVRLSVEKMPVYNKRGKIKHHEDYDWFKTVMSGYQKADSTRTVVDDIEDAKDLKPMKPEKKETKAGEETLQGYKTSAEFVLERHLRREEALLPGSKSFKTFTTGRGDNAKEELVYLREDVQVCKTAESWHKEGRAVKAGEHSMKMVPVRAVTLTRKREVEEAERDGGVKLKQGLYSWDQTNWIIPPPIENGVIPKNAFGNMDCYVPSMVPKGAVHIPLRSTMKICKRLGIDFAEAVTGFEFGNKRAVPIITGVVVAEENEHAVIDQWETDEEERRIKEEGKREKVALATWRKWLMGLRIIQRVQEEYGGNADAHIREEMNPFTNQNKAKKAPKEDSKTRTTHAKDAAGHDGKDVAGGFSVDDVEGGGFLPEDDEKEEVPQRKSELTIEDGKYGVDSSPVVSLRAMAASVQEYVGQDTIVDDNGLELLLLERRKSPMIAEKAGKSAPNTKLNAKRLSTKTAQKRKISPPTNESDRPDQVDTSKGTLPATTAARAVPKRKSARTSIKAVKSHYFEHESESESDQDDIEGEMSEELVAKKAPTQKSAKGAKKKGRRLRKSGCTFSKSYRSQKNQRSSTSPALA